MASRILRVEVARVIDRARLAGDIDDSDVARLHEELSTMLRSVAIVGLDEHVLGRAAGAMPTALGTLDAIHLATALELSRDGVDDLVVATHDAQLARAARASGLRVVGV